MFTNSQFFRSPARNLPGAPRSESVSPAPAPPSISAKSPNRPDMVKLSVPPPRLTLPVIEAPDITVTVDLPSPPMIAVPVAVPTDAPLWMTMETAPLETESVLIAALPEAVPPVTLPATSIDMPPEPVFFAEIPILPPETDPVVVIETVPPLPVACIP